MKNDTTARLRVTYAALFVGVITAAVVGWFLGKPVEQLNGIVMWVAAAIGIGEGSNIGKRATWKAEAAE
jgi:hypothetical protein